MLRSDIDCKYMDSCVRLFVTDKKTAKQEKRISI